MWGVKNITFIDHGSISYSNPIRQNLYLYSDCLISENKKAPIAAKNLKSIAPFLKTHGIDFSIPIPGQLVTEQNLLSLKNDILKFEFLIKSFDVIFLLTDTRESRWLPTFLSFVHHKVLLLFIFYFISLLLMLLLVMIL